MRNMGIHIQYRHPTPKAFECKKPKSVGRKVGGKYFCAFLCYHFFRATGCDSVFFIVSIFPWLDIKQSQPFFQNFMCQNKSTALKHSYCERNESVFTHVSAVRKVSSRCSYNENSYLAGYFADSPPTSNTCEVSAETSLSQNPDTDIYKEYETSSLSLNSQIKGLAPIQDHIYVYACLCPYLCLYH